MLLAVVGDVEPESVAEAARRGHRTMNGAAMLIYQAVFALEHFTDTRIEARPMLDLLRPLLEG